MTAMMTPLPRAESRSKREEVERGVIYLAPSTTNPEAKACLEWSWSTIGNGVGHVASGTEGNLAYARTEARIALCRSNAAPF